LELEKLCGFGIPKPAGKNGLEVRGLSNAGANPLVLFGETCPTEVLDAFCATLIENGFEVGAKVVGLEGIDFDAPGPKAKPFENDPPL
jgi:hypothetical protein